MAGTRQACAFQKKTFNTWLHNITCPLLLVLLLPHTLACTLKYLSITILYSILLRVLSCKREKSTQVDSEIGRTALPGTGPSLPLSEAAWSLSLACLCSPTFYCSLQIGFLVPHSSCSPITSACTLRCLDSASSGLNFISLFSSASHSWPTLILDLSSGFPRRIWLLP